MKVGADMSENVGWMRKTNDFTRGMSIVGPWKIPVSGRLTGFDLRVVSDNELSLEVSLYLTLQNNCSIGVCS